MKYSYQPAYAAKYLLQEAEHLIISYMFRKRIITFFIPTFFLQHKLWLYVHLMEHGQEVNGRVSFLWFYWEYKAETYFDWSEVRENRFEDSREH